MKVLADRVAIIPIEDPDTTPAGLFIPDTGKQNADQGVVKYIGRDVKDVKIGDHVLFSPYSGTQVSTDVDGLLVILPEKDIVCMLEGTEERLYSYAYISDICARLTRDNKTLNIIDFLAHLKSEKGTQF